jgi:hypothetical protein
LGRTFGKYDEHHHVIVTAKVILLTANAIDHIVAAIFVIGTLA